MLCFRCEHRAKYLEEYTVNKNVYAPRAECYQTGQCVISCYLFQPVKPISIKPIDGDVRPLSLNILSCRIKRVDAPELELTTKQTGESYIVYWQPPTDKSVNIDMGLINDLIQENKTVPFTDFYEYFKTNYLWFVGPDIILEDDYDIRNDSKKNATDIMLSIKCMQKRFEFTAHISEENLHQHTFKSLAEYLYQEYLG